MSHERLPWLKPTEYRGDRGPAIDPRSPDPYPLDYSRGPHDTPFGVDDADEPGDDPTPDEGTDPIPTGDRS